MRVARFDQRWDLFGALRGREGVEPRGCWCRVCNAVEHKTERAA